MATEKDSLPDMPARLFASASDSDFSEALVAVPLPSRVMP